jgi:hypothetical protein
VYPHPNIRINAGFFCVAVLCILGLIVLHGTDSHTLVEKSGGMFLKGAMYSTGSLILKHSRPESSGLACQPLRAALPTTLLACHSSHNHAREPHGTRRERGWHPTVWAGRGTTPVIPSYRYQQRWGFLDQHLAHRAPIIPVVPPLAHEPRCDTVRST